MAEVGSGNGHLLDVVGMTELMAGFERAESRDRSSGRRAGQKWKRVRDISTEPALGQERHAVRDVDQEVRNARQAVCDPATTSSLCGKPIEIIWESWETSIGPFHNCQRCEQLAASG